MTKKLFEGIKVADFTWVWIGPLSTKRLADYGAEVIKIETETRPLPGAGGRGGTAYKQYNTNKLSLALNLSLPKGVEVAKRLVAWADIVAENMTAGAMKRMGLGYEELKKVNPDIIMLSASLCGQEGPHATQAGMGSIPTNMAGLNNITGWPDRDEASLGPYSDFITPHFCALAVLAALDYRRRTGKGQYLDLSALEVTVQFAAPLMLDYTVNQRVAERMGNRLTYAAPHGAYRCQGEDRWCAIAVFTDKEWKSFCQVIGNPAWTDDARFATLLARKQNEDELDRLVEGWTINHSAEEVITMMQEAGVAAGVVQNYRDVSDDPQLEYRHFTQRMEHPGEKGEFRVMKPHFVLSKVPRGELRRSPLIGEHNQYVLKDVLGLSDEEISELVIDGVIQ